MCTIDTDEGLKIHIEGLQSTLGKRNARIKELEEKLAQPIDLPEKIEKMLKKAYKDGWQDCSRILMENTKDAALALGKIHKVAWNQYLEGQRDSL